MTCEEVFGGDLCKQLKELEQNAKELTKEIDLYVTENNKIIEQNEKQIETLEKQLEERPTPDIVKQLDRKIELLNAENKRLTDETSRLKGAVNGVVTSTNTYMGSIREGLTNAKKRKLGSVAIDQSGPGGAQNVMEGVQEQEGAEGIEEDSFEFVNALDVMVQQTTRFKNTHLKKPPTTANEKLKYQNDVQLLRQDLLRQLDAAAKSKEVTPDEYNRLIQRLEGEIRGLETLFK